MVRWYDANAENPAWIKALADVRRMGTLEGYCYQHVQAIMIAFRHDGDRCKKFCYQQCPACPSPARCRLKQPRSSFTPSTSWPSMVRTCASCRYRCVRPTWRGEEAQRILAEHLEPGALRSSVGTIHQLVTVLERPELVAALKRMKASRGLRVVK